jgi:hypothetical protein
MKHYDNYLRWLYRGGHPNDVVRNWVIMDEPR